jgi:hypothetical protein
MTGSLTRSSTFPISLSNINRDPIGNRFRNCRSLSPNSGKLCLRCENLQPPSYIEDPWAIDEHVLTTGLRLATISKDSIRDLRSLLLILSIPRPRWLVVERLDRALVLSRPRGDLEEHILLDPLSSYSSPTESAWHTSVVRRAWHENSTRESRADLVDGVSFWGNPSHATGTSV